MTVVRKNDRILTTYGESHLRVEHLASRSGLSLRLVELPPVASTGERNAHEGEECHLVLKGKF